MHTLELVDMQKEFKKKIAVNHVNAILKNGVYGLLGENGAGKTTLMRMVCGILQPTQGNILCDGMEISQMGGDYRRLLGYLPQDFGYYVDFSAYRYLMYIATLKAIPEAYAKSKIEELLEIVDLAQVKDKKLRTYSGGMLKRVGIAQALLNNPEILILDEPTSGLDPKERVRFRNIISSLSKNRTIILSTHIVSDVEYIADEIMMMKKGRLLKMGTVEQISEPVQGHVWECLVTEREVDILNRKYVISNLKNQGNEVYLRIVSEQKPIETATPTAATLEDTYLFYLSMDKIVYQEEQA